MTRATTGDPRDPIIHDSHVVRQPAGAGANRMSISITTITPGRKAWELVRCDNSDCGHEHVRQALGRLMLPCQGCGAAMHAVPLITEDEAEWTNVNAVRQALRAARDHAQHMIDTARTARARAIYTGHLLAYSEVLELLSPVSTIEPALPASTPASRQRRVIQLPSPAGSHNPVTPGRHARPGVTTPTRTLTAGTRA